MGAMRGLELRLALDQLRISQADFARLLKVTPRAVNSWVADEQGEIPGPVEAYFRLILSLPPEQQFREISRLKRESAQMLEGLYHIEYAGVAGSGHGSVIFNQGKIQGADFAGGQYDGVYAAIPGEDAFNVRVRATVPAGTWLVQGVPAQQKPYTFEITAKITPRKETVTTVQTTFGPVNVKFIYLRGLDQSNAA